MARFEHEMRNINLGKATPMAALVVLVIMVVVIGLFASLKIVPTGHVGVLRLYGTEVTGEILTEGFHFANPFKKDRKSVV